MTKIVYNIREGGFGLSRAGVLRYAELKGIHLWIEHSVGEIPGTETYWTLPPPARKGMERARAILRVQDIARDDLALIATVMEQGSQADGPLADLRIRELPPGTRYQLLRWEDGREFILTVDEYCWRVA